MAALVRLPINFVSFQWCVCVCIRSFCNDYDLIACWNNITFNGFEPSEVAVHVVQEVLGEGRVYC